MHYGFNVFGLETLPGQQKRDLLQVGDSIELARRLLGAEAAVQIAADSGVAGVAGKLADVVNVVRDGRDAHQ